MLTNSDMRLFIPQHLAHILAAEERLPVIAGDGAEF